MVMTRVSALHISAACGRTHPSTDGFGGKPLLQQMPNKQTGMASSCTRKGSGWITGKTSQQERRHRLPEEVVLSLSLEVFRNHGDAALKDALCGHGGGGLMVELGELRGLFQP